MKKILVIGSLNIDFVTDVVNIPKPGETILSEKYSLVPGGKGANQAYAIGKLGGDVSMIGAVGNDSYKDLLLNNLDSVNVNTKSIQTKQNENTGIALIYVDQNGENSIVVISGANKTITKDLIDQNMSLVEQADIIVMQLEIPIQIVSYVSKIASKKQKLIVLDPAPARNDLPDELFLAIDIIKPNETELEILSGMKIQDDQDVVTASNILLQKGVKNVIATLGEKGSILTTIKGSRKFSALDVKTVDTTAAGDTFTAGLVVELAQGKTLEESIQFGHIVSSIVVTKKGAQSSIPGMEEIKEFMEQYTKEEESK